MTNPDTDPPSVFMAFTNTPAQSGDLPDIMFDSGASCHMWNHSGHFTSYTPDTTRSRHAVVADGRRMPILGQGDIGLLKTVLYVPSLTFCLLSPGQLRKQGYEIILGDNPRIVNKHDLSNVFLHGVARDTLFCIPVTSFERQLHLTPLICAAHEVRADPALQIHQMLGHASAERCFHECKCNRFPGLKILSRKAFQSVEECVACAQAKTHRKSAPGHLDIPEHIGQIWYVDVKGPVATPSLRYGNHYVFGIIEAKTKFLLQYFIKTKDEVLKCFKLFHDTFIPYVRTISPHMKAIFIISDKGEFNSEDVHAYCAEKVLTPLTTCSYSPQQNGLIERTWRTISEASIAMCLSRQTSLSRTGRKRERLQVISGIELLAAIPHLILNHRLRSFSA